MITHAHSFGSDEYCYVKIKPKHWWNPMDWYRAKKLQELQNYKIREEFKEVLYNLPDIATIENGSLNPPHTEGE